MTSPKSDAILSQILSCLDTASARPGMVKANVHQTEGYLRGLQGLAWEKSPAAIPGDGDVAGLFLYDVRNGLVPLRGRIKKETAASLGAFLAGLSETFPGAETKSFAAALSRLWVRWSGHGEAIAKDVGSKAGEILKAEYEEGIAGDLSAYLLDDRLHLRDTRDFLRMRGWLRGTIEHLRRKSDWDRRERADVLESNFSSIVLRALHNANVDYAAAAVAGLPRMTSELDQAIGRLAATEPEACHFLRKNRSTVLTRALHSGYLDYPAEAAKELPKTLKELNSKIRDLEETTPEAARDLRANVSSLVYRALTNGKF